MTEAPPAFEHPMAVFPAEHYLVMRQLAKAADEEHPPCQGHPELWWQPKAEAKAVEHCLQRCTMRLQCLQFALTTGETDGVWGGKTPAERKSMTRTDTLQESIDPPRISPSREPAAAQALDIPSDHRVQERAPRHDRARRSEQAAKPAAQHRPLRDRQPV